MTLNTDGLLSARDVEQFRTETLVVWIRRPDPHHTNWWLCFYTTDAMEVRAWNHAIQTVGQELKGMPFHQGTWPIDHRQRHPGCDEFQTHHCPGVIQAWEIFGGGCSQLSLHFQDATLDELVACGDASLEELLAIVPKVRESAEKW